MRNVKPAISLHINWICFKEILIVEILLNEQISMRHSLYIRFRCQRCEAIDSHRTTTATKSRRIVIAAHTSEAFDLKCMNRMHRRLRAVSIKPMKTSLCIHNDIVESADAPPPTPPRGRAMRVDFVYSLRRSSWSTDWRPPIYMQLAFEACRQCDVRWWCHRDILT